jgi:hypothetical protein
MGDHVNQAVKWFNSGVKTKPEAAKLKKFLTKRRGLNEANCIYYELIKLIKGR